jgi:DNA mismatch repair ATPase MutS
MQIDKTTLNDLSVFHADEEYSLFNRFDYCRTNEGRAVLKKIFSVPLESIADIKTVQEILKFYQAKLHDWPLRITNGNLLVIEKFLDDQPEPIPTSPNIINATAYKLLHPADFSMIVFSMKQVVEFFSGFREIVTFFSNSSHPKKLDDILQECRSILSNNAPQASYTKKDFSALTTPELLDYARLIHVKFISETRKLIKHYGILDAWYAMAKANQTLNLHFPQFIEQD